MGKNIALNSQSRVYMISGRARGDHKPSYESCMRMTGLSQDYGDVTKVECPDPDRYGAYVEVGQIRGATGRVTTSLEGKYYRDTKSTLMELSAQGCPVDIQLHFGKCEDPKAFNDFSKILFLEDVYLINHGTDDLGSLESGSNASINETADISARVKYEILPIGYGVKAGDLVTNEIIDVVICDSASCGECEDSSSGCDKIFAISKAAGGSAGTPGDLLYSPDKGITWYANDIDSLGIAEDPSRVACVGDYIVVVSQASGSLHYALKSEFKAGIDPAWSEVLVGFVGQPTCIYSTGSAAYIGAAQGYIYYTEDVTAGVTVLDAGSIFVTTYNRIHGIGDFVVVVGRDGAIAFSTNGVSFSAATSTPVGVGTHLTALAVKSESEWWIGTSGGKLYYTLDAGVSWTEKTFPGSGAGTVYDIKFATDSTVYLAHSVVAPASRGRILRSNDGGYSWVITPESGATIPVNDRLVAIAVCEKDPGFIVGVGLADNGTDGIIIVGQ